MTNRTIGRIISIDYNEINVSTISSIGDYVSTDDGINFVGELGSFMSIDDLGRRIIAEVASVDEKAKSEYKADYVKAINDRYITLHPVGEIINGSFKFGVTKMPPMFSEVKLISNKDLQIMMDVLQDSKEDVPTKTKLIALPIGKSVLFPDYDVKVRLNDFFGFHFAVLGNTGSGKSNTIALILQKIFKKTNYSACGAKFIIFDSNGEYDSALSKISDVNDEIKIKKMSTNNEKCKFTIPVWALSVDDWAVLLHASEKTQMPIINRALELIRILTSEQTEEILKIQNHIIATIIIQLLIGPSSSPSKSDNVKSLLTKYKTPQINLEKKIDVISADCTVKDKSITITDAISVRYGNIMAQNSIIEYIQQYADSSVDFTIKKKDLIKYSLNDFKKAVELAIFYEGSTVSNKIYEYSSTLITRLQHLIESEQGQFLTETKHNSIKDYIDSILGDNQILNVDISNLDDSATEVITKVFSKMLFDYLKNLEPRNSMPINLILEEAHRFIKNTDANNILGYNIFERIAREGRKYGLLLGISSQRPSELSKTVISQCSNFIIHRMQNPDDIQYISKMVPYIDKSSIERITYLQRGTALVFGTAINLPMLTQFEQAYPQPNSYNSNITELWYCDKKTK